MDGGNVIPGGAASAASGLGAVGPLESALADSDRPQELGAGEMPDLRAWRELLAGLAPTGDDAGRIDQLRLLEELKSGCAAAQARITAAFAASRRAAAGRRSTSPDGSAARSGEHEAGDVHAHEDAVRRHDADGRHTGGPGDVVGRPLRGVGEAGDIGRTSGNGDASGASQPNDTAGDERAEGVARGGFAGAGASAGSRSAAARERREWAGRLAARSAAAEVALARRQSPARGGRFVGLAEALVHEMPHTLAALQQGVINEWRATLIVRETAFLTGEQRSVVDAELAGRLDGVGDARLVARVRALAYRLNPQGAVDRSVRAAADRRVSVRPAPEAMAYLTTLMPMVTAVACFAELDRRAKTAVVAGDGRTQAQRMADEVARLLLGAIVTPSSGHATTNGAAPAPTTGYTSTGVATPTPTGPTAPAGMPATDAADAGVHESAADDERPDPTGQDGERPNPSGQDGERPDASGQDGEQPDPSGQDGERHGASGQDGEPPDPCGQDDEPPDPSGQDGEPPDPSGEDGERPDPSGEDGERPDPTGEDGEWAGHH
jgi:hypothetical protein